MTSSGEPTPRTARLVLTSRNGAILGQLAPVPIATPWWQDVAPVIDAVREHRGVSAIILRLLSAELAAPPGGEVTYLAEIDGLVDAAPWVGEIEDHPLRMGWAKPGGPAADLGWARAHLTKLGREPAGSAVQVRSWNLSSLWRLPYVGGAVWLKIVPPFLAHEGAILAHLAGEAVPSLLAHEGRRMLLAEAAGEDLYQARPDQLTTMIDMLVDLQCAHLGRAEVLLGFGVPDWRAGALTSSIAAVAERSASAMSGQARRLAAFVRALPARLAAIADAGPGEGLIHGDFHPGNFRGRGLDLTLLDWGDSGVGHPLLDMSAFLEPIAATSRGPARAHWRRRWRAAAPGMDFDRAADLIAPLAAARRAAVYQGFLDRIEPSEHPYHAADPVAWLTRALDLADAHDF